MWNKCTVIYRSLAVRKLSESKKNRRSRGWLFFLPSLQDKIIHRFWPFWASLEVMNKKLVRKIFVYKVVIRGESVAAEGFLTPQQNDNCLYEIQIESDTDEFFQCLTK